MNTIEAIILGILQGLTEPLPVSSSGHLRLARVLFGFQKEADVSSRERLAFDVLLHFATLIVIVVAFRKEILSLLKGRRRVWLALIIGSVPAGIAGVGMKMLFDSIVFPLWGIGVAYLGLGAYLMIAERFMRDEYDMDALTPGRAFIVGLAQAVAILPGVSRSGSTIIAGGILGLKRNDAMAFSFLLGIIAIGGATLLEFGDITALADAAIAPVVAGFLAALIAGFAAMWAIKKIVAHRKLAWFAPYCIALGVIALVKVIMS